MRKLWMKFSHQKKVLFLLAAISFASVFGPVPLFVNPLDMGGFNDRA